MQPTQTSGPAVKANLLIMPPTLKVFTASVSTDCAIILAGSRCSGHTDSSGGPDRLGRFLDAMASRRLGGWWAFGSCPQRGHGRECQPAEHLGPVHGG